MQKARDTRDTDLEERGHTIIRLALELRIHQAADLWTAGIRERQAQLMFTRAEKITPTVAEVICSENETDADLQIASLFQELRDAAKALHHWHQG